LISSKINQDQAITIGILGGGQLAKMIEIAGYPMGLNFAIIENGENTPAGNLTQLEFTNGWKNKDDLDAFIEVSDIITLENEFIDIDILEYIEQKRKVYPTSKTMKLVRDKYIQKTTFENSNIKVAKFDTINSVEDGIDFGNKLGFPFILKAREFSYDGYGNEKIDNPAQMKKAWEKFNSNDNERTLYAEEFVPFTKELAVMIAMRPNGEYEAYPCVETIQKNHICHKVIAPAQIDEQIKQKAQDMALQAVKAIDGIGVFGIEMFLTPDNEILLNEIAPRPHNSGHYTIEACYTSQFENCIRAILDLPLGSAEMIKPVAIMINTLGEREGSGVPSKVQNFFKKNKTKLHLYGKSSSRVGRKMGHITTIGETYKEVSSGTDKALKDLQW